MKRILTKGIFFELMIRAFVVSTIVKTWSLNNLVLFKRSYSSLPEHVLIEVEKTHGKNNQYCPTLSSEDGTKTFKSLSHRMFGH